tara:strand:- start:246 stop:386 length:141 start_codon:yes stop_codon:yes gene_type:complete
MRLIPEELFGLKIEVRRSRRKTSALHIVGNALLIRIPNRVRDSEII